MATTAGPDTSTRPTRTPPYSEEAERGVLGAALLDAHRVLDLCIERQLLPESFYVQSHRVLFEVLLAMHNDGRPIDLLTSNDRLRDLGRLDEVGGTTYLERIIDSTPTSAHAEYYIDIVRQKFLLRCIIDRSREAIDICYGGEENADSILDKTEQSFFSISENQRNTLVSWPEAINTAMKNIETALQKGREITGAPTGFHDLDRLTKGFQPGDMVIIAARPSMGKTSLAMNIAENAALGDNPDKIKIPVAVFSLEMSHDQLVKRMLCSCAEVASYKISGGYHLSAEYHQKLVDAADKLSKASIYVDDSAGLSAVELRARARRLKRKYNIGLIVIDYLQMMNYPQYAKEGRQRETAAISGAMKAMAKELKIPVIVLSQLSRAPETRDRLAIPKLSDLRDSGSIEQDADVVCLLRRPCKYPDDQEFHDKTLAILDIAKQRNGPTGEIRLNFEDEITKFKNRVEGVDRPEGFAPSSGSV